MIGKCPICDREMFAGTSNRHHFLPRCKGGKETEYLHIVCHDKIHSLFSEKELAKEYHDPEKVRAHEDMQNFIKWVSKKEPDFVDKHKQHSRKR